jgi:hypothetical protein
MTIVLVLAAGRESAQQGHFDAKLVPRLASALGAPQAGDQREVW